MSEQKVLDDGLNSMEQIRLNTQGVSQYLGTESASRKRKRDAIEPEGESNEAKRVCLKGPQKATLVRYGFLDDEICRNPSESTHIKVLGTPGPAERNHSPPISLQQPRSEDELVQYCTDTYGHLAFDINTPVASKRTKHSGHGRGTFGGGMSDDGNEDNDIDEIQDTCPTWQSAVESEMDELRNLMQTSDSPLKIPRDYLCAAKQFRAFREFQQDVEAFLLRFRRALDQTRYTADGSLREELAGDDRTFYWNPFKGKEEFIDRFAHEPPMVPLPRCSGYFREKEEEIVIYKPPKTPPIVPKPPNALVSNALLEFDQRNGALEDHSGFMPLARRSSNLGRPNQNSYDELLPEHDSKYNDNTSGDSMNDEKIAKDISSSSSSSISSIFDNDESDADTVSSLGDEGGGYDKTGEREKSEHGCCQAQLKPAGSRDKGSPERTKESERDKMSNQTHIFQRVLLQYEKNKHLIRKWSEEDRRKERKEYVSSALSLIEASLKGTFEELPKWRPDLKDYQHDELIYEKGPGDGETGALEAIWELKGRLDMAELLLRRSAMNRMLCDTKDLI